jgi:hypothetical protein
VKYYKDEGFIERKIEIDEDDLERIIEEYLSRHADFDFDEIEIVNNRPMNIWLYAKCRTYIDPDTPKEEQIADAEVQVSGKYDGNPTRPSSFLRSAASCLCVRFAFCRASAITSPKVFIWSVSLLPARPSLGCTLWSGILLRRVHRR